MKHVHAMTVAKPAKAQSGNFQAKLNAVMMTTDHLVEFAFNKFANGRL